MDTGVRTGIALSPPGSQNRSFSTFMTLLGKHSLIGDVHPYDLISRNGFPIRCALKMGKKDERHQLIN
jgi:hypothetical protein